MAYNLTGIRFEFQLANSPSQYFNHLSFSSNDTTVIWITPWHPPSRILNLLISHEYLLYHSKLLYVTFAVWRESLNNMRIVRPLGQVSHSRVTWLVRNLSKYYTIAVLMRQLLRYRRCACSLIHCVKAQNTTSQQILQGTKMMKWHKYSIYSYLWVMYVHIHTYMRI
jgi:hypothetical protein